MSLSDRLMQDLQGAMRARDELRVSVLRLARSAVKNAEIAQGSSLNDADIMAVLGREARQRRDSIVEYRKAGRLDLAQREEAELHILLEYLPTQMSKEEILPIVQRIVAEVGAAGPRDMGKVMPRAMDELRGKAEGALVSSVVRDVLSERP